MSKNITLNGTDYIGISTIKLPTVEGGTASFTIPSGTKTITTNGTHNVADFESVLVNIATSGGGSNSNIVSGEYTPAEDMISPIGAVITHSLGVAPNLIYFIAENVESYLGNGETLTLGGLYFNFVGDTSKVKFSGRTSSDVVCTLISDGTNPYFTFGGVSSASARPRNPEPTETEFCLWNFNNSYMLKGGVKLKWCAVKIGV